MAENPGLRRMFRQWMGSDLKAMLILFYARNPGVIETVEGLARRLGTTSDALAGPVHSHIRLGLLKERRLRETIVLVFDRGGRAELEKDLVKMIRGRMGEDAAVAADRPVQDQAVSRCGRRSA